MANTKKQLKLQVWEDTRGVGNVYESMHHLLASAKREGWQQAKLGRMVLKYHNSILDTSDTEICNSCDYPLDTERNVRLMALKPVHRTCLEYPQDFKKAIDKAVKEYDKR